MNIKSSAAMLTCLMFLLSSCSNSSSEAAQPDETVYKESPQASAPTVQAAAPTPTAPAVKGPVFQNVSVHDPSVIKVDDTFYVFGSHLASAKSTDLMKWSQITSNVNNAGKLIPNVREEMKETLTWSQTDTFWAGDVIQLADGKFYMYYSNCKGDSPRASLGLAVADNVEGPYKNVGLLLKSGMWGQASPDGKVYDATVHPNVVDPDVFFDKEGKLWMVYGSYSGGIYIMKLDPKTGLPYPDQGYGKKLLGANHSRIEGPYMLYSPETDYYYMFLSYGGLDAKGGYNIRVARSKAPDGPFVDAEGQDMINAKGRPGSFFDDRSIEKFGVKLMGNMEFTHVEGEVPGVGTGYVSPGHNSAYYEPETKQYFLIFHSRFPNRGESHEVRVHQMFMNADGWPIVAPHRYGGEMIEAYPDKELAGEYKLVNHGKDISADIKKSVLIQLNENGTISGAASGQWNTAGDRSAEFTLDGMTYKGVFLRQWDNGTMRHVMTFTALSADGTAIWGSHVAKQ